MAECQPPLCHLTLKWHDCQYSVHEVVVICQLDLPLNHIMSIISLVMCQSGIGQVSVKYQSRIRAELLNQVSAKYCRVVWLSVDRVLPTASAVYTIDQVSVDREWLSSIRMAQMCLMKMGLTLTNIWSQLWAWGLEPTWSFSKRNKERRLGKRRMNNQMRKLRAVNREAERWGKTTKEQITCTVGWQILGWWKLLVHTWANNSGI